MSCQPGSSPIPLQEDSPQYKNISRVIYYVCSVTYRGLGLRWVLARSQAQKLLSNLTIIVMFKFWEIPEINCGFDKYRHASIKLHKSYVPVLTFFVLWRDFTKILRTSIDISKHGSPGPSSDTVLMHA
jgi:hypothetical protein